MQLERRYTTAPVTLTDSAGSVAGTGRTVRGCAAVFNTRSGALADQSGAFVETIAPGAFDSVLGDTVLALLNHDSNFILARSKGGKGTLSIGIDATGLWYRFVSPETTAGNDLIISLKRGDISESSFAFSVAPKGDTWKRDSDGLRVRIISKVSRLYDVSAVARPAYAATTVSVCSAPGDAGASNALPWRMRLSTDDQATANPPTPERNLWAARLGIF